MENWDFHKLEWSAWKLLDCKILHQIPQGVLGPWASPKPLPDRRTPFWKFLPTGLNLICIWLEKISLSDPCQGHAYCLVSVHVITELDRVFHCRWRALHSWSFSSEGSLVHQCIMVFSEDLWHSHLLPTVWQCSCHYLFLRLTSVVGWIWTPSILLARWTL